MLLRRLASSGLKCLRKVVTSSRVRVDRWWNRNTLGVAADRLDGVRDHKLSVG